MTTACVSADFQKPITTCQFGGNPDCANCGCIASAALAAVVLPVHLAIVATADGTQAAFAMNAAMLKEDLAARE